MTMDEYFASLKCPALEPRETIAGYKIHPIASSWPLIIDPEMEADICTEGILEPITLDENGLVIDGRTRLAIHEKLLNDPDSGYEAWRGQRKVPTKVLDCDGNTQTVLSFCVRMNECRRHLSGDQRNLAKLAAIKIRNEHRQWLAEKEAKKQASQFKPNICPNPNGRRGKEQVDTNSYPPVPKRDTKAKNANSTVGKVAAELEISHHKAASILKVEKEAPELIQPIINGEIKLVEAVAIVKSPEALQAVKEEKVKPAEAVKVAKAKTTRPADDDEEPLWLKQVKARASMKDIEEIRVWANKQLEIECRCEGVK